MSTTPLLCLLNPEYHRQRAALRGGFSMPLLSECKIPSGVSEILATNTSGFFIEVRKSQVSGYARFGFFSVPIVEEPVFFVKVFIPLLISRCHRFATIPEALRYLSSIGAQPKRLMTPKEFTTNTEGLQVTASEGLPSFSIVSTDPGLVGTYTRVDTHLGIQLFDPSKNLVLVG